MTKKLVCELCGGPVEWIPVNGFEWNIPFCSMECEYDACEQEQGYPCTSCKLRAGEACPRFEERCLRDRPLNECSLYQLDESASTYAKRSVSPTHYAAYELELANARRQK